MVESGDRSLLETFFKIIEAEDGITTPVTFFSSQQPDSPQALDSILMTVDNYLLISPHGHVNPILAPMNKLVVETEEEVDYIGFQYGPDEMDLLLFPAIVKDN